MTATQPAPQLDDTFQTPVKFTIVASLVGVDKAEFAFVRDAAKVSDSVMSKQASALESTGYLEVIKGYVGKRPRTWYRLTPAGREAFAGHLAALQQIAAQAAAFDPGVAD